MWGPPNKRELHGDLQGYKVIIRSQNTSHYWNNFTLDSDITSLLLENLTVEEVYWVKVAAYNRKGIGPFSKVVELKVSFDISEVFDIKSPIVYLLEGIFLSRHKQSFFI